ncbi:kinase-like domain-containing protein [Chaetomium strumarium]|uniref:Kinase-like domain-containing protein n=1 Tax=Chaetomium strumarium TaxID=1170767 RepID=A0AAJ0M7F9_9PEZI|nr:kinase-like domain-containing protein [Chaetomium strumarium]
MEDLSTSSNASDRSSTPDVSKLHSSCHWYMYQARPITPPQDAGDGDLYSHFPNLDHVEVSPVALSPALAAIWRDSTILDYGSYASIRALEHGDSPFPILKLAHPDTQSLELIQHEFNILSDLKSLGLPVPEIDTQPIVDGGRICGYRMKALTKLKPSELRCRQHDIRRVLLQLHSAGFCHGDVTPSNIMQDGSDRIILIDFGFAGRAGSAVPPFIPSWVYAGGIFEPTGDWKAFERFFREP